jgi:pyruvate,orthophosphate dikinase
VGISVEKCKLAVQDLQEVNPMLGCRGSRLAIMRPEITQLQTQAIVGAAVQMRDRGEEASPQILIPLVCTEHEVIPSPMIPCSISPSPSSISLTDLLLTLFTH